MAGRRTDEGGCRWILARLHFPSGYSWVPKLMAEGALSASLIHLCHGSATREVALLVQPGIEKSIKAQKTGITKQMNLNLKRYHLPDSTGIRPITCHACARQEGGHRFVEQEVVLSREQTTYTQVAPMAELHWTFSSPGDRNNSVD